MQFFHVSITLVAQELVVTAQIEKKWILPLLSSMANSLVFSSLKMHLHGGLSVRRHHFFQNWTSSRPESRF